LKAIENRKEIDKNTFNLKVLEITDPGTIITIFSNSHKVLMTDEIQETGGFSKNYHLKHLIVDQVFLKAENAKGKSKYLYLD
jgi:pyruvate/2-oxoglutarate/acetoin dehydrogenase E1 component